VRALVPLPRWTIRITQALARDDDHCGDVGGLKDEYLNRKIPFVEHLTRLGNKKDCSISSLIVEAGLEYLNKEGKK
jgi:hypothetical protein